MEELGYIISKRCSKDTPIFVECVHHIDDVADSTKPYLIVGYKNAKEILGDKFNILNKRIDDKHFWTFSKTEKRADYERDTNLFYDCIISDLISDLKYYYLNIFSMSLAKKKKLVEILQSNENKYIYICDGMIYVYYNGYVMGISLKVCKYCNLNCKKIISRLYKNKSNIIITDNSFLDERIKNAVQNKKYAMAYFISLTK